MAAGREWVIGRGERVIKTKMLSLTWTRLQQATGSSDHVVVGDDVVAVAAIVDAAVAEQAPIETVDAVHPNKPRR